jgi:uncharacterized protein YciI
MARHIAYWQRQTEKGNVLIFGPVHDGNGASGLAIAEADNADTVRGLGDRDPAVTTGLCGYDVGGMSVSITRI